MVDGRDFPRTDARTNWGYSDRALARRAVEALDRAEEPFAALALTVSNHHPFKVPADAQTTFAGLLPPPGASRLLLAWGQGIGRYAVPMIQTVHYTDEAVGDFFRLAQKRPWYSRTVFVISGDHGLSIVPLNRSISTLAALTELRHRVPMILFSPMLRPGRVPGPASQADLPETILALAGLSLPRAGTGRDLLDPMPLDTNRQIVTWSAEGRVVSVVGKTRTYQASVAGDVSSAARPVRFSEELLFDPSSDPDGKQNLLAREPHDAKAARRIAEIYLEAYAWILLSGSSGVPEDVVSAPRGREGDGI